MEESIIGYDIREMGCDLWDEARREVYLLNKEIQKPLSTDATIWPSVFENTCFGNVLEECEKQGISYKNTEHLGHNGITTPDWTGLVKNLWENLREMEDQFLSSEEELNFPCWSVAFTVFGEWDNNFSVFDKDSGEYKPLKWSEISHCVLPDKIDDEWLFLGFDVSDGSLVSGLSNCGYIDDEIDIVAGKYTSKLNKYGLFDNAEDAIKFCKVTDDRVKEHAPFFTYGIWMIEEIK